MMPLFVVAIDLLYFAVKTAKFGAMGEQLC